MVLFLEAKYHVTASLQQYGDLTMKMVSLYMDGTIGVKIKMAQVKRKYEKIYLVIESMMGHDYLIKLRGGGRKLHD
jgi:ribosomal protein S17